METLSNPQTVVIVGAGQAGGELATALRQGGHAGRVVLVGDELHPPYRRPQLSKSFLVGESGVDALYLKPAAAYEKAGLECIFGVGVTRLDRAARTVNLGDGRSIAYDRLAMTTGGTVRKLPLPGADKPNVRYLRSIDDAAGLRQGLLPGARLLVIGGGFIGLEVAASAVKRGLKVTVLESLPRVMARVMAAQTSAFYEDLHRGHGVDIRTGVEIAALHGCERVEEVVLASGERFAADLVVVGIGLVPNTQLAADAGLSVSNGIVVDEYGRTSDPDIVAAGDCTFHNNLFAGCHLRLESVQNAIDQARSAAATLCGKPQPYHAAPWFWSDQYDVKLQMTGISEGYQQVVVRGDMRARSFTVFYLRDGRVIAADAVNSPQDFMIAKHLVAERAAVDPAPLADAAQSLKSLLQKAAA